jgi:hypothetical protein
VAAMGEGEEHGCTAEGRGRSRAARLWRRGRGGARRKGGREK